MRLRNGIKAPWGAPLIFAGSLVGWNLPDCLGQDAVAPAPVQVPAQRPAASPASSSWTPLAQALQETASRGVPTVVVITSRSNPESAAFRDTFARSPEAAAIAHSVRFAEMPAEIYATQLKKLGINTFPTFIVYRKGNSGLEPAAARGGFRDGNQVFAWLDSLGFGPAKPLMPITALPSTGAGWTPLAQALQETVAQGVPTVVVVTSQSNPGSAMFRELFARSPEAAAMAGFVRFAEMPVETYGTQVKSLGIKTFPTFIVYRRGKSGLEPGEGRGGFGDGRQVFAWLGSLGLGARNPGTPSRAPSADAAVEPVMYEPGYASEQQPPPRYAPPKQPPIAPPTPYVPPYTPAPQPQMYAPQPQQYVPAPAPYYIQPQTPAMIVQQAPQQIILAPPAPPQVTVAMAAPVSYAPQPMQAPANIFTQPAQAPQPMQAPQPQPMQAPQPQPMMMAPQPMMMAPQPQPMMAPQPAQAPQQVVMAPQGLGQAPTTAMMFQAPGLFDSLLGAFGEHLARRRNPRVQMSPMPTLAQAPVANAPVGMAPSGYGQAPTAYAPVTGYAPAGPPMALMSPEATSFAPCNTYGAPCRYHGGPCPAGSGGYGPGGGGYAPPSPPYPSPSPQTSSTKHGWFDWTHKN